MKKILVVGENPFCMTGNGNFMAALLSNIDTSKYQITCFAAEGRSSAGLSAFRPLPFALIDAQTQGDQWGNNKLIDVLKEVDIDVLLFVGIDLWRYIRVFRQIDEVRKQKGFKWIGLFPYDLQDVRKDWVFWINMLDYPCVYSQYGLDLLTDHVPGIRYFRPPLYNHDLFQPVEDDDLRKKIRRDIFKTVRDDDVVFGFVGGNSFRKDIPRLIKAFLQAKEEVPGINLYLHTELVNGAYNLKQFATDYGGKDGDLLAKEEHVRSPVNQMVKIYNSIDCLINCTMQEGLSWTPLEAMLCGTPVIASDTTAHTELVLGAGHLVPCKDQSYVHVATGVGPAYVDAKACSVDDIRGAIICVARDADERAELSILGRKRAQEWLSGVSDINELLSEATKKGQIVVAQDKKINKILFAQHSAAGDVLMTTQCFKGIKERHPGMKLCYMTQSQYADIVEGNPYIDEVVLWDTEQGKKYEIVYNPHGEHILSGNFNSGDVRLYEMYPYFCKVEADDMFIEQVKPEIDLPDGDYIVVQTSGGATNIRTYKHMDLVLKGLGLQVVHMGSVIDLACHGVAFDLRGKLTWREAAWVMARAKAAVVIDSFPAHLAGALGTPVVVLYGPAPARVTGCRGNYDKITNIEPNWLDVCPVVAACYGKGKCSSPCINSINPMVVRKALLSLIEKSND